MARRADTHYEDSKEDLYQISLLIDQLKHDDVQLRTNACKNLPTIAAALGPEVRVLIYLLNFHKNELFTHYFYFFSLSEHEMNLFHSLLIQLMMIMMMYYVQ
jgi:hypothetical protein